MANRSLSDDRKGKDKGPAAAGDRRRERDLVRPVPQYGGGRNRKPVPIPKKFIPRFWEQADGRSATVRLIRERVRRLMEDAAVDSYQKELLCQRAAFVSVVLETQERDAIDTGQFNVGSYVQAVNGLVGLLKQLGLERKVKASGGLKAYLAEAERKAG